MVNKANSQLICQSVSHLLLSPEHRQTGPGGGALQNPACKAELHPSSGESGDPPLQSPILKAVKNLKGSSEVSERE